MFKFAIIFYYFVKFLSFLCILIVVLLCFEILGDSPRASNIIRVLEKILHSKRFLGKKKEQANMSSHCSSNGGQ